MPSVVEEGGPLPPVISLSRARTSSSPRTEFAMVLKESLMVLMFDVLYNGGVVIAMIVMMCCWLVEARAETQLVTVINPSGRSTSFLYL